MAKRKRYSIVDEGASVEGTLAFSGLLLVRGRASGNLEGGDVTIAERGEVSAEAVVDVMTVGGRFTGEVHARRELRILPGGHCSGAVVCRRLVVEEGGRLDANVRFLEPEDPAQTGPAGHGGPAGGGA